MTTGIAGASHKKQLSAIWKTCFNADDGFMKIFIDKCLPASVTYIVEEKGEIISSSTVMPLKYIGASAHTMNGGYLYGVCTMPEYRGRRLAARLMEFAENDSMERGMEFMVTRPASASLFKYYENLGYSQYLYRQNITIPLFAESGSRVLLRSLTPERIAQLRKRNLDCGYTEWDREIYGFFLEYIKYCKGIATETQNGGYIIGTPDDDDNSMFNILECGYGNFNGLSLPDICSAILSICPEARHARIFSPAIKEQTKTGKAIREKFALLKPLSNNCPHSLFFNFSME